MVDDFPIITAHGNYELYIENFAKIHEFNDAKITLTAKKQKITVSGRQLVIEYMNSDDIKISGVISGIKINEVVS